MKFQFKNTPVALAVAALFLSPVAFAEGNNNDRNHDPVSIKKNVDVTQDVTTAGRVGVGGYIGIDSSSMAVVNDSQVTGSNTGNNNISNFSATVDGNTLNNAKGNIGLNVTAGDNNQQANAGALAAADASFVFGSADAEAFASQVAMQNTTHNLGQSNLANLGGNALVNASGNIGVNVSAGNSNQQKNDLAVSVAVARMATATTQVQQVNGNNTTTNDPVQTQTVQYVPVNLTLNASGSYAGGGLGGYAGYTGGTYSGQQSGTTSGNSYQSSNFYPDTWNGNTHPCSNCSQTGHIDMDSQAQGAVQNPNKPGVGGLGFDNTGTYSGSQSGTFSGFQAGGLGFAEAGSQALSGSVTGNLPVVVATNLATTNISHIGDNVLMNASGNIGVNVSSGTNNQQFNGLSLAATQARVGGGSAPGQPGGGEFTH
jgi:hypothetical protein